MNGSNGSPLPRMCRAGVFAAVAVGVSVAGHIAMSGHQVPIPGFAAGFAVVFAAASAVAGSERGYWTILGWMAWSQLALHVVFAVAQAWAEPAAGAAAAHHAGSAVSAAPAAPGVSSAGSGSGMLAAHAAAAMLSSWWLRTGEAAAFALARYLRALLFPVLLLLAARWRPRRSLVVRAAVPRRVRVPTPVLRHAVVVRGPPSSPHFA